MGFGQEGVESVLFSKTKGMGEQGGGDVNKRLNIQNITRTLNMLVSLKMSPVDRALSLSKSLSSPELRKNVVNFTFKYDYLSTHIVQLINKIIN